MIRTYSLDSSNKSSIVGADYGLKFIKEFRILKVGEGQRYDHFSEKSEIGLVVLTGGGNIKFKGKTFKIGGRKDVFNGLPKAFYFPPENGFQVCGGPLEVAICETLAEKRGEFKVISESDIIVNKVGKENWEREVRLIIPPRSFSQNLIIGETLNPSGNWSGTPAHKHEIDNLPLESLHEELYFFKTQKPQGWGIQRIYSDSEKVNELIFIEDNTVTLMPFGYHQVVAGPGHNLYYLFFLSGKGNNLCGNVDEGKNLIKVHK
jgi:5-deoxy-glucuronate isomerase